MKDALADSTAAIELSFSRRQIPQQLLVQLSAIPIRQWVENRLPSQITYDVRGDMQTEYRG